MTAETRSVVASRNMVEVLTERYGPEAISKLRNDYIEDGMK